MKENLSQHKQYIRSAISLVLAYLSLFGLEAMLKGSAAWHLSNSLFSIIILIALTVFYNHILSWMTKRLFLVAALLGSFFSACMVLAANLFTEDTAGLSHGSTWLHIMAGLPFFMSLVATIFHNLPRLNAVLLERGNKNFFCDMSLKKYFAISWILIMMAYLPALLSLYPGIFGYDTIGQLPQHIYHIYNFTHPPIHTFLLSWCVVDLGNMLGTYERGLLVYSLLQMSAVAAAFSLIACFLRYKGLVWWARLVWQLFFMFQRKIKEHSFTKCKNYRFSFLNV